MLTGPLSGTAALRACAGPTGRFAIVSVDQRSSLARLLDPAHPERVPGTLLQDVKRDLVETLGPAATAVLLDPDALAAAHPPRHTGLVLTLEADGLRQARLIDGWSVVAAQRAGADAVKVKVRYNPLDVALASHQRALVARVVEESRPLGLPVVLEGVLLDDDPARRPDLVVRTAGELAALGPDLYKAEFPGRDGDAAACRELDAVCGGVPWVLLSGGTPLDQFAERLEVACRAGASGFLAGRAIWQEAVTEPDPDRRRERLAAEALANQRRLLEIVEAHARPWTARPSC